MKNVFAAVLTLLMAMPMMAHDVPAVRATAIETSILEEGQCTARIIMPDGTIYEGIADTCMEAVLVALALKKQGEQPQ